MLVLIKNLINLVIICSLLLTKSMCFSNFNKRNDSLEVNNYNTTTADSRMLNFYSIQWQKLPRVMRKIPTVIRRRSQHNKVMVQKSIYFIYYKNGQMLFKTSPGIDTQQTSSYVIDACGNEKTSFIFHGWTESCATEWVIKLMERLTYYRGGCIVCIDYGEWSGKNYLDLVRRFNVISHILHEEFVTLINNGLNPKLGYMFGFSYGGQLASKIGRLLQPEDKFQQIDICDIAGPGFDFLSPSKHHEAADNVQCYYSSLDKGSQFRSCHQNILLGHCGYRQPAVLSQRYFSSHGLCVQIYVNAFDFPFYAVRNAPNWCVSENPVTNLPSTYTIGYDGNKGNMSRFVSGDIFVPTSLNYPYNLSKRELILYEKYLNGT